MDAQPARRRGTGTPSARPTAPGVNNVESDVVWYGGGGGGGGWRVEAAGSPMRIKAGSEAAAPPGIRGQRNEKMLTPGRNDLDACRADGGRFNGPDPTSRRHQLPELLEPSPNSTPLDISRTVRSTPLTFWESVCN